MTNFTLPQQQDQPQTDNYQQIMARMLMQHANVRGNNSSPFSSAINGGMSAYAMNMMNQKPPMAQSPAMPFGVD